MNRLIILSVIFFKCIFLQGKDNADILQSKQEITVNKLHHHFSGIHSVLNLCSTVALFSNKQVHLEFMQYSDTIRNGKVGVLKQKIINFYSAKTKRSLFVLPFAGYNATDNIFAGIGIFTNPVNVSQIRFRLFPSWSFGNDRINYSGRLAWYKNLNDNIYIKPFTWCNSYSYEYTKNRKLTYFSAHTGVEIYSGKIGTQNNSGYTFRIIWHSINQEKMYWNFSTKEYEPERNKYDIFEVNASCHILHLADENNQELKTEFNKDFCKFSFSTVHRLHYHLRNDLKGKNKGIEFRLFAGSFIYKNLPLRNDYRFRLSGFRGVDDYLFYFPYISRTGRNYNFFTNQIYPGDGFFKTAVPLGQSWDWLAGLNIRTDIPGILPLQIYSDFGAYSDVLLPFHSRIPWNMGIVIQIWERYIEIFIPLLMSDEIKEIYNLYGCNFFNRITWMVRFDKINPFKILNEND